MTPAPSFPPMRFETDIPALMKLWPGGKAPRLFPIDPVKHYKLAGTTPSKEAIPSLNKLKTRLPPDAFGDVLGSLGFLLRYSDRVFPAFRCLLKEFVNDEWLALVDYRKDFHRDHVVHQPQVALVAKRLLEELRFSRTAHPMAAAFGEAWWTPPPDRADDTVTLRQLAAFMLARGSDVTRYLSDYAVDLGLAPQLVEPRTPVAYWFWYEVVYDACVIGGLFHDIGYPVQFLQNVMRTINDSRFTELVRGGGADRIEELFDDPLCLMPFRGYQSRRGIARSHTMRDETGEAIGSALRETHGLPGALTFLHLNHEVMDIRDNERNAKGRLTMEMAALGMVMHDMRGIYAGKEKDLPLGKPARPYMRVSFERDPVSFVLSIADLIQSYGRFHSEFRMKVKHPVLLVKQRVKCVDLRRDGDSLEIVYLYEMDQAAARLQQHTEFNPYEQARYFHPRLGYIDYDCLFDRITLGTDWA